MAQHDIETKKWGFNGLWVLGFKQLDVVADDIGLFVELEDLYGVACMRQIWKDVADLSSHVVRIGLEEIEKPLHETFIQVDGFCLGFGACWKVGDYPTGLSTDYLFMVMQNFFKALEDASSQKLVGVFSWTSWDIAKDANRGD